MSERRRAEIADKRARLAQLKLARQQREELARTSAAAAVAADSSTPPAAASPRANTPAGRTDDIDALLRTVGVASPSRALTQPRSRSRSPSPPPAPPVPAPRPRSPSPAPISPEAAPETVEPAVPTPPTLVPASPQISSLPPRPKVVYDKAIQTSSDLLLSATRDPRTNAPAAVADDSTGLQVTSETTDELRAGILAELEAERVALDRALAEERALAQRAAEAERARGLPAPQLASVLSSPDFSEFVTSSTRVVQRALSDSYDYLRDYSVMGDADGSGEGDEEGAGGRRARCRLLGSWQDAVWGRGRSVTGLDWSYKYPELLVASYNKNPLATHEPDGIAAVWNLHLQDRPEFVFHAQSDILSIAFSPFHPNLVVGGTYSGQIHLWDTRSRHAYPVLKTPLSSSGHTHPVYALSMVGTPHAHSLVSASTDGVVCAWALDMLARPHEKLELLHPHHPRTDEVSVTALGFAPGETNTLFAATEEGPIYPAHRYDRAGAKAGLVQGQAYRGHAGPVTGIDFHPAEGSVDLSDLFLTCGVDWTVKLWRVGGNTTSGGAASAATAAATTGSLGLGGGSSNHHPGAYAPLMSFEEADDYVYDVRWHPHHPALFGSVDGTGRFDVWNLNVDTEVPLLRTVVGGSSNTGGAGAGAGGAEGAGTTRSGPRPSGLNKLAWDRSREGRRAAVGSADGRVYVYELASELVTPREDEWERMRKTCAAALGGAPPH